VKGKAVDAETLRRLNDAELFLFDFDGTLVEFHRDFLLDEAILVNEKLAHPFIERELLDEGFRDFDFFRFIEPTLFEKDAYIKLFWEHFAWEGFPESRLLPETLETLQHLAERGKRMAIVTSRSEPRESIEYQLERCGIREFFCSIQTRSGFDGDWSDKKPQINATCEALGVEVSKTVMIGDVPPDVTTAREIGVGVLISVLSGGINRAVLESVTPHLLLQGVRDLRGLIV